MKHFSQKTARALFSAAILLSPLAVQAQPGLSVAATGSNLVTSAGARNLVVDNALSISGTGTVTQATVTISSGYQSGDTLGFNNAALPSGVSGSFSSTTGVLTFSGSATAADYQALLRTVTLSLNASSATTRSVTFTLGDLVSFTNGHYYKFVTTTSTWANAKTAAAAAGNKYYGLTGYLATVTSAAENAFIKQTLSADGWIGASDDVNEINAATGTATYANQTAAEGHWYWVTGPEAGTNFSNGNGTPAAASGQYMNWTSGEPNNSSGSEHYAEIYASGGNLGYWNDLGSANTLGYVVEYGGLSSDPTVQLSATRNVQVQATSIEGTYSYNLAVYNTKASPVVVDGSLSVSSTSNITDARVTISSGFNTGDSLHYTGSLPGGVTASYNATTGVLSFTGTATPAQFQSLLRTVTFSARNAPNVNREVTFSVGNLVSGSNGHFYKFVSSAGISWSSAKTAAAGQSYLGYTGYLATITSSAENALITQKLSSDGWIGASDDYNQINAATGTTTYANQSAAEGHWYWVTGPEAGTNFSNGNTNPTLVAGQYMNWNTSEPNNSSGEHYAQIFASGSVGKWNDLNGSSQNGYVVEFGGLASDPLVTLSSTSQILVGSPLPIDGIMLDASAENAQVKLRWNTLNERGTQAFDVERSADGIAFSTIGNVSALGNGFNNYRFTDEAPLAGTGYYRIKALDADGSFVFSNIRLVKSGRQDMPARLVPNPASGTLTLSRGSDAPASLTCTDAAGRVAFRRLSTSATESIDISRLSPGAYVLTLDEAGRRSSLRFVRE